MLWGLIKPNDWQKLHVATTEYTQWTTYMNHKIQGLEKDYTVMCILVYSPSRNKTRIDWDNIIPENRERCIAYQECVKKEIEFWKEKNGLKK